jgi:hypothetical protein
MPKVLLFLAAGIVAILNAALSTTDDGRKLATAGDQSSRDHHDPIARIIGIVGAVIAACALVLTFWQILTIRDNAQRQLRAYIVVSDTAVICPDCGDTARSPSTLPGITNFAVFRMQNNGQTPAYNVSPVINWWPVKEATKSAKLPADFKFEDHKQSADESGGISFIGKDNHRDTYRLIGSADIPLFKEAVAQQSVVFLYGHIDYCDIFNSPHSTVYCFRYVPNSGTLHLSCDRHNGEAKPLHKCDNDTTR